MDSQIQFDNWLKKYGTGGWRLLLEKAQESSKPEVREYAAKIMNELQDICEKRANELCGIKG